MHRSPRQSGKRSPVESLAECPSELFPGIGLRKCFDVSRGLFILTPRSLYPEVNTTFSRVSSSKPAPPHRILSCRQA